MKTVYLVRHGESEGNIGSTYQVESTPLSEAGRKQAQFVAERAKKLPIEALIASTMMRAQETAGYISEATGISIESSDLFVERRRPSEQIGQPKDSPESKAAEAGIIKSSGISGYWFSDEENFDDLKARAAAALSLIEEHPSDNLLIVTHGVFMRVLAAYAVFGTEMTGHECTRIVGSLICSNTGITVLQFDPALDKAWRILTWNDHAHLG